MNFDVWYTDTVDVWRVVQDETKPLISNQREQVLTDVPCRVYRSGKKAIQMQQTAANINQEDSLACGLDIDIQAGDELYIHRGARIGKKFADIRAFAAAPNYYPEPVGNIMGGLAHQEIQLLQQERV